jgi:uncharacterized metal-binding protein
MSAGYVHTRASLILASGFVLGTLVTRDLQDLQYVLGALTGVMISPDCDVDSRFIAYTYIKKRLGYPAWWLWDKLWHFYRKSIKHGSELSHFPVVGTLGRLAYLFLFVIILPSTLIHLNYFPYIQAEVSWWFGKVCQYWRIAVALMGADLIHWGLDILTTEHKKGTKRVHGLGLHRLRRNLRKA